MVSLDIQKTANDDTRMLSEGITLQDNGIVPIPHNFLEENGLAEIAYLTVNLLEPTHEDDIQYHINIDIIGCYISSRGKFQYCSR